MTVRIVTDSTADLPNDIVQELGITVVPLFIHLDDETFEDGVSINPDMFYRRLMTGNIFPKTSAPSSSMFIEAYQHLAQETDEILSMHISTKLSAVHAAATVASEGTETARRIEVVDSLSASLGLGLLVVQAAILAKNGATLDTILHTLRDSIPRTQFFGVLETLEYLRKGGRLGHASTLLGSVFNLKPILCLHAGVTHPIQHVHGREQALERLCEMVGNMGAITHLGVTYTTDESETEQLVFRLSQFFPEGESIRSRCGCATGTYFGPGALGVAVIQAPGSGCDLLSIASSVALQS